MTEKEYNLCIDNYSDSAFLYLVKNIKDSDAAKDILQEAFTKLWEKREDVDFLKAKSYLFTSAYHIMINNIKYNSLKNNIPEAQLFTSNAYNDINEVMSQAMEMLPQIQKASILLRDYEGYSYKEIGDILNLSQEQVKINIFRARVQLREYIVKIDNVL